MTRRRPRWAEAAAKARAAGGAWVLHSSLAAGDYHLLRHARRRVKALRPTQHGQYELRRGIRGNDDLGREVFDIWIRYKENDK